MKWKAIVGPPESNRQFQASEAEDGAFRLIHETLDFRRPFHVGGFKRGRILRFSRLPAQGWRALKE
jgi:hypothetical protein